MLGVLVFHIINAQLITGLYRISLLIENKLFSESPGSLLQSAQFPCSYIAVVGVP
jgi:hypothetical protein